MGGKRARISTLHTDLDSDDARSPTTLPIRRLADARMRHGIRAHYTLSPS